MNRPKWWNERGMRSMALLPAGLVYACIDAINRAVISPKTASRPVICIGNLTAGGAGKTPVTQALAKIFIVQGYRPAILSRGYGRLSNECLRVDPSIHSWEEVGDEPLLHADICPTYVAANRLKAAELAVNDGADFLLLDDGLQHHKLLKDISIEVRHHEDGLGNGYPIPAGPLRQWFGLGSRSVDICFEVGREVAIKAELPPGWKQVRPVGAFCGIADPNKFSLTLRELGVVVDWFEGFADHHPFSKMELDIIEESSKTHDLLTTKKDWVRLPENLQRVVSPISYGVRFRDPQLILSRLLDLL